MGLMNVPALAQKTFDSLKNDLRALEIVQYILRKLSKTHDPLKRARFVHRVVDEAVSIPLEDSAAKKLSPCQKGCSFCCHTQVSVSSDEAKLLAHRVREGTEIDLEVLLHQAEAKNASEAYYRLSFAERRCVFLDDAGACRVYDDRPSVCRTNIALGEASQCDTSEGIRPTRLLRTQEADLVVYASYLNAEDGGTLSYLLAKELGLLDS